MNKNEKQIIEAPTNYFDSGSFTSDELRDLADRMDKEGIISLEIDRDYDGLYSFSEMRLETDKEFESRLEQEERMRTNEIWLKEERKQRILREAKELGLKVEEQ